MKATATTMQRSQMKAHTGLSTVKALYSTTGSVIGYRAMHAYSGQTLVYVAEFTGRGDTKLAATRWLLGRIVIVDGKIVKVQL